MNLRVHPIVVTMVVTMFTSPVMAVDPMMTVLRPMAWNPDHFIFTLPVTRAMAVVWPVTEFDSNSLRLDGAPESEARQADRREQ